MNHIEREVKVNPHFLNFSLIKKTQIIAYNDQTATDAISIISEVQHQRYEIQQREALFKMPRVLSAAVLMSTCHG